MKFKLYFLIFFITNLLFANVKLEFSPPNFSISYPSPSCVVSGNLVQVIFNDNTGAGIPIGLFSSTAGLVIDPDSGTIDAGASVAGTYVVAYTTSSSVVSNTTFNY